MDIVYDLEVFPNTTTCVMMPLTEGDDRHWVYECSIRRCDGAHLAYDLRNGSIGKMIGFNNVNFDYPVLHFMLSLIDAGYTGEQLANFVFNKAQEVISAPNPWDHRIWEPIVQQVDLFLIHHFDNKAKMTSLKTLEFNMRSPSIEEMPFPIGTWLQSDQIDTLIGYNLNDVRETKRFAHFSNDAIKFREDLMRRGWFGKEVINMNDASIGKNYFKQRLEKTQPGVTKNVNGRKPQTRRATISLAECIFPYVRFEQPALHEMHERLRGITFAGTETKNAYKECVQLGDITVDIGQGGIHGSIANRVITADIHTAIIDLDVTGYYPSLAIVNRLYPEHLGPVFCDVYRDIRDTRETAKEAGLKVEAGTLKLATNGTFGDFGNVHSVFYDPKCLISVTINGQLLLLMLAEQLMRIWGVEILQMNTDGLTISCPRTCIGLAEQVCNWWESVTCLRLECNFYSKLIVRDVNNYIAIYE